MTKISTYVVDEKVTALDKWIGSDANMQNRTKNFTPKKLAAYFNEDQVINIGTPLQYKYYTLDPLEARPNGTLTFETEIGPTVNFSSITTFLLSKYTTKQNIVSDFLNFLDGSKVLLFKSSDINSFGFYRISSLEPYEPDPNFFIVTVAYETGNGALEEDEDYMISLVSLAGDFIPTKTSELINDGDDGVNPFISELDINRTEWDEAYDGKINSAEVTGTATKTLTLTKQDGGTIEASWTDSDTGLTSVGVSMPTAFSVANSPLTSNGTINITGAGTSLEYIKGDGTLGVFPTLTGYIPYTGATQDVDLGTHQLKADSLAVSTTSTETVDVGEIVWNSVDGTFDMGLIGGVTLQAGQELHMYGKATEAISNGQAVMFAGVQGDHILIAKADAATINANPEYLIGIATQDFVNNQFGYVTVFGNVRGLNTTGYTLGSVLYYNSESATDGLLTSTMPTAPNAKIIVSAVVRVHATQGILLVRPHTMPKLKDVQDVYAPSPSSNNGLFWNSSTLRYENNSIIGALGYTPYNATNPSNYITLGSISSTATGLTYTNTTGVFSLTSGYVIPTTTEESNWNDAYSNRITSASTPLSVSSNAISISQAGSSTNGYLTSADWNTFNDKQVSGNYITSLTGEATASGPGAASVTLNNASITAKILSGVNITGGTILDTDTMLTAFGKLQNQINSLIGGSIYQGVWNASTNTPTLTSSVGTDGNYYIVNVAGSTNLNGITDWKIGDWAIFHGGTWQKVDNTDAVSSVNGFTGAVSLTTDNIPEGTTNLYYLDSRARSALSFAAGSGAYNSTTGVITIPTNTTQLTNGSSYITLASLSGTAPIGYNNTTGAISITQAGTTSNGFLSSTDWNTFNGKANDSAVVHIEGVETVNGIKTFSNSTKFDYGINLKQDTTTAYFPNYTTIDGYNNGYIVNNGDARAAIFYLANNVSRVYNFPDANGTFALTSDLSAYQPLLTNPITGTGTTNYVPKFTGSTALGNSLIYDNGTNVFVGGSGSNGNRFTVVEGGTTLVGQQILMQNASSANDALNIVHSGTGKLIKGTKGVEVFNITNSGGAYFAGNVGINTTTVPAKLSIALDGSFNSNSSTTGSQLLLGRTNGFGEALGFRNTGATSGISGLTYAAQIISEGNNVLEMYTVGGQPIVFGTSATERMRITSGGQVLINTTTSTTGGVNHPLVVKGTSSSSQGIWVEANSNDNAIYIDHSSTVGKIGTSYRVSGAYTPLAFETSGEERMRITSGGNVGIGTTSPSVKLQIAQTASGTTNNFTQLITSSDGGKGLYQGFDVTNRRFYWRKNDSDDYSFSWQKGDGTSMMLINSAGNVGIGTASPSYQLQLSTDSAAKPTSALWTIASDERIKENINSYTKGLNELLKINPITYDYNGLGGFKKGKGGVGIIAQEIAEILPDSVSSIKGKLNETDEEEIDILNFNGHELTYILINAVKELKAEIELLKAK